MFRSHNKCPHSGGKTIYNNISRTRASAGLGTSHNSTKLTHDPSPQVCNLDCMVTQHTFMAVDKVPDPIVDSVQISAALTSHSEVSFLIPLSLPGLSDPVSTLVDLGATSNFLDLSLATVPPFVLEPLDRPITLCLFDCKPVTARFIHESVNISVSFADHLTQSLSLL